MCTVCVAVYEKCRVGLSYLVVFSWYSTYIYLFWFPPGRGSAPHHQSKNEDRKLANDRILSEGGKGEPLKPACDAPLFSFFFFCFLSVT